jgi:hypothetical protein
MLMGDVFNGERLRIAIDTKSQHFLPSLLITADIVEESKLLNKLSG